MKQVEYYKNGNRTLRIKYEGIKKLLEKKDKEIERLNNIINKVYKYLDKKKDVPEWWDTDFMICMDILKGGTGYLKDILGDSSNDSKRDV